MYAMKRLTYSFLFLILLALVSCHDTEVMENYIHGMLPISLSGEIEQVAVTRVNDNGFANGDVMGVYVVDYKGGEPGKLQPNGNRADNVGYTFDAASGKWTAAYDIYWKDEKTHADIYGYYPFASPADVRAYDFEVRKDQSVATRDGVMGGYEASDFLWAKAEDVAPTDRVIRLPMRHRMSNVRILLSQGVGFAEGEWNELVKQVLVLGTTRRSVIDLSTGEVNAVGEAASIGTIPFHNNDEYRAIVVPQTVKAGQVLFSITVGGVPYTFKKEEPFVYVPGKMHRFTIRVDKKEASGKYSFTLAEESITAWENDLASHEAEAKTYVVVHVDRMGTLKECIEKAKLDYTKLKNLKLTGKINQADYYFLRDSMPSLRALNLKSVRMDKDEILPIPNYIEKGFLSLISVVLPDTLKKIGGGAFSQCKNLTGSLVIPEGVTEIGDMAFNDCNNLRGTLTLPSTLKIIGTQAFEFCGFVSELKLPQGLQRIENGAFLGCSNLYGELVLPSSLTYLGSVAFASCSHLTGGLSIPQGISEIRNAAFNGCGFDGMLELHDGINIIEGPAFGSVPFTGELRLPKNLVSLGEYAFNNCHFTGVLELPAELLSIAPNAFYANDFTGVLKIPDNTTLISGYAFYACKFDEIILPKNMEWIGESAFADCNSLTSVVSKSLTPPRLEQNVFGERGGDHYDRITVEVPEAALIDYQTDPEWGKFRHIVAHHELACSPKAVNVLNARSTRTLELIAEGDWELADIPSWCSLSQTNGTGNTQLTLICQSLSHGAGTRSGELVFKLKDKNYTTRCTVKQYDYAHDEDEIITLQKATKGQQGGIDLIFLGDGYNADDIVSGIYLEHIKAQVENFFAIEPYYTYRDYFNVYTSIAVSPERWIGLFSKDTNRFGTVSTSNGLQCNQETVFQYALRFPGMTREKLKKSLLVMVPYGIGYGDCILWEDGSAIAFCPVDTEDARTILQHNAGGHGFGKLGDETAGYTGFILPQDRELLQKAKERGWMDNLSLTNKINEVPWAHLISDSRYNVRTDMYEGGYGYSKGVFRSEQNSCMRVGMSYFNAISRESIVKRIKQYAGETFSFEDFVAHDNAGLVGTRAAGASHSSSRFGSHPLKIHKGSPLKRR